ncbi:MAG TPA: methanogenesis marker 7 protein [Methanoregulaceae archaeon]|nr:methanogenesis marker 7 protein [Methanoregulaceae archaeon]
MNLVPITYKGGIYQHDVIVDLIDDLGGYIIQKHILAQEVVLQALVPREDIALIARIGKPLTGEITPSPLVGTEIAVVTMSLEIHHLPHASCDVAEYIRRFGAKTNMVGLARGFGKRIAQLNDEERDVINEHDIAVYLLGDFETCIEQKFPVLRRGIRVPIVVLGGPSTETLRRIIDPPVEGFVGGVGRFMHRTKESEELEKLEEVAAEITRVLDKKRDEIAKDPPSVSPARLMDVISDQLEDIHAVLSPTPITVQMTGLRVKLPYDTYAAILKGIIIEGGVTIGEVADILPSRMRDYILVRVKPFSETNIMV